MDAALGQERVLESYFLGLFGEVSANSPVPALQADNARSSVRKAKLPSQAVEQDKPALPAGGSALPAMGSRAYSADCVGQYIHLQPITVAGVELALPKECVADVLTWPDKIEPPALAQPGVLGYSRDAGLEYTLIDMAALVVPVSRSRYADMTAEKRYQYAVLVGEGSYALACERVDEDIILASDGISWRKERRARSWLAGTVAQFGYLLLDVDELVAVFS